MTNNLILWITSKLLLNPLDFEECISLESRDINMTRMLLEENVLPN